MRRHHQHKEPVRNPEEGAVQRRLPDHRQGVQTVLPEGEEEPRWDPDAALTSQPGVPKEFQTQSASHDSVSGWIFYWPKMQKLSLKNQTNSFKNTFLSVILSCIWASGWHEKLWFDLVLPLFPPPDGVRIRNKCSVAARPLEKLRVVILHTCHLWTTAI